MGKGTIISGGTDGQYDVQINYARAAYTAKIAALEAQIAAYTIKIDAAEAGSTEQKLLKKGKLSVEKRKQYLENNMPDDKTISAWCSDLTEDLTGQVGLVEVPGEAVDFNIQPGYEENAVYDATRDGQLMPTIVQNAAQAFYNLAMLPGWQKWKPTYRYGTITSLDGDTANVSLESAESSQQSLNVNQESTLSDVAIEYMDCNGAVFEDGDDVLIKFENQDFAQPKIIGFKEHPKPCNRVILVFYSYDKGMLAVQIDKFGTITRYPLKDYYNPEEPATIEPISGSHSRNIIFNGLTPNDSINSKDLSFFSDAGITHEDSAYGFVYGACGNEVYHTVSCPCGFPYEGTIITRYCRYRYRNNVTSSFAVKEEGPSKYYVPSSPNTIPIDITKSSANYTAQGTYWECCHYSFGGGGCCDPGPPTPCTCTVCSPATTKDTDGSYFTLQGYYKYIAIPITFTSSPDSCAKIIGSKREVTKTHVVSTEDGVDVANEYSRADVLYTQKISGETIFETRTVTDPAEANVDQDSIFFNLNCKLFTHKKSCAVYSLHSARELIYDGSYSHYEDYGVPELEVYSQISEEDEMYEWGNMHKVNLTYEQITSWFGVDSTNHNILISGVYH